MHIAKILVLVLSVAMLLKVVVMSGIQNQSVDALSQKNVLPKKDFHKQMLAPKNVHSLVCYVGQNLPAGKHSK